MKRYVKATEETYRETLIIPFLDSIMIEDLLENGGMSENEAPIFIGTVTFSNMYKTYFYCFGADEHSAYIEAVLFDDKGYEVMYTDPHDSLVDEYEFFDDDNNSYFVDVEVR